MKVRDVIRQVEADGWTHLSTRGSHRQFTHPTKKGRVTITGHPSDEVPTGTRLNILRQAGLRGQTGETETEPEQ